MERKQRGITTEDIGETRGCHTRYKDRQQCRHRHIDHQHLQRKHQSGYRSLKDAGDSTCRTTAYKRHQHFPVHMEQLSEVRTNSRTRQHNRSLSSHRTTEADGDGRGDDRRPAVMRLQPRPVRRDGIEDTCDTVRDIVLDDISDEQRCQIDTYNGIDQIEPVCSGTVEGTGEQIDNLVDDPMEHKSRHSRKEADNQREDDHKHLLADMLHPPFVQPLEPLRSSIVYCFHSLLGTDYTAFIKDTAGCAHKQRFSKRAV